MIPLLAAAWLALILLGRRLYAKRLQREWESIAEWEDFRRALERVR